MNKNEILSKVDHTLLAQSATWEQIKEICDDGINFKVASICIPASFVKQAKDYVGGRLAICTVIIPLCFMALHTSCFFNSVPHCLGCLLVGEGEVKPPYDANDLKSTCFSAYLAVMMVFAPMIIKENVTKGYKGICAILIIAGVVFIGFPLGIMQYM